MLVNGVSQEGPAGQVPVDVLEGLESYGYSYLQLEGAILMGA